MPEEPKVLMNKVPVKGGEGPWSVSFGGKTLSVPSRWSVSCYATYKAYGVNHVVRGGQRSAYRSSDLVVNTSGAIFTTGVGGKKASYSNKVHGIRVALTVDE